MSRLQTTCVFVCVCVCVCECAMPCNLVERYQYSQEPVADMFSARQATLKMKAPDSSETLVPVYQSICITNKKAGI
jgi:hypothetical protein